MAAIKPHDRPAQSDDCRLSSVVVGSRYLVLAQSFHALVVSVRQSQSPRRPVASTTTVVGVYGTSGPLVPLTVRSRRIAVQYSNLAFGQYWILPGKVVREMT